MANSASLTYVLTYVNDVSANDFAIYICGGSTPVVCIVEYLTWYLKEPSKVKHLDR